MSENETRPCPCRWIAAAAILFCAGVLGREIYVLAQGVDFLVRHITIDDTFYYLNTAWYAKQMGFVTFDAVNPTNGVQFLWFWILYAFSFLFDSRGALLTGTMWMLVILNVAAVPLMMVFGKRLWDWRGAILAGAMAFFLACQGKYLMMGLENTIHLIVFLLAAISLLRFLQDRSPTWYITTMALLALNVWARLDSAVVSAIIGLYATIVLLRSDSLPLPRRAMFVTIAAAICGISAGVLFWGNYKMGGSSVPVSGLWKKAPIDWAAVLPTFFELWGRTLPAVFPIDRITPDGTENIVTFLLTIAVVVFEVRAIRNGDRTVAPGVLVLMGALFVHTIVLSIAVEPSHSLRGVWYQSPHFALMIGLIVRMVSRIPNRPLPRFDGISVPTFSAGLLVIAITLFAAKNAVGYVGDHDETNLHGERLVLARWIRENLPEDARLAAFNTGELGFFSERRATNLDGLINSFEYFEYRQNGGTIIDYLRSQGIDYFVDYNIPPEVAARSTVVHEHPLPERDPIQVRRMDFSAE
ncbi:hypothetical protein KQI84_07695 [bacterium]|nr:hypothetical protein [bacterium]